MEIKHVSERMKNKMNQCGADTNVGSGETLMGEEEAMLHDLVQTNAEPPNVVYNFSASMLNAQPITPNNETTGGDSWEWKKERLASVESQAKRIEGVEEWYHRGK